MTLDEKELKDLEYFRKEMESDLAILTSIKAIEDPEEQFHRLINHYTIQYLAAQLVMVGR